LSVRAKKDAKGGKAELAVADLEVYANDGEGTALDSASHSFSYTIKSKPPEPAATGAGAIVPAPARPDVPRSPSADFDGNGKVTIVDMSILTVHIIMPYDPRYDLDMNGAIGLSDLSILFARM
jgi:hypothetical protein